MNDQEVPSQRGGSRPGAEDRYSYSSPPPPRRVEIIEPEKAIYRPMQVGAGLAAKVFEAIDEIPADECDFISDAVRVEKKQIELLLEQIAARHAISYRILNDVQYRETDLAGRIGRISDLGGRQYGMSKPITDLERQLSDIQRERNMEQVSLWRDSQKALTELFRHWTTYTNLTRRAKVINLDL